jgi:hypothetical protein
MPRKILRCLMAAISRVVNSPGISVSEEAETLFKKGLSV